MKYAWRALTQSPSFNITAVLAIALGIGATTVIFSAVDSILLRPLPYPNAGRLVAMDERDRGRSISVAWLNYRDWRNQNQTFEDMALVQPGDLVLNGDEPQVIEGSRVTASLFPVLGVKPILGRTFSEDEDRPGGQAAAVLSWSFWQSHYGGNAGALGQSLRISGGVYTVIGVMPKGFRYEYDDNPEIYLSLGRISDQLGDRNNGPGTSAVGLLKPGVQIDRARADLATIGAQLAAQYPATNGNRTIGSEMLLEHTVGGVRKGLLILMGAVGLVLLIACANVANLLLARGAGRAQEIHIRVALGASRAQLMRLLLGESLSLAVTGGSLGVLLAWAGLRALVAIAPQNTPRLADVGLNPTAVLFAVAVSLVTGVLFGIYPAIEASRGTQGDLRGARTIGNVGGRRASGMFVIAEIALSVVLLAGAGLLINSFLRILTAPAGFDSTNTFIARVALRGSRNNPQQLLSNAEDLQRRIAALPHVRSASISVPLLGTWQTLVEVEEHPIANTRDWPSTDITRVTPDFFKTLGITLKEGRLFDDHDRSGSRGVAIVDELFVQSKFGGGSPLGKRIRMMSGNWLEIVGVVGHVKSYGIDRESRIETYIPYAQDPVGGVQVAVRTDGVDAMSMESPVRAQVNAVAPGVALYRASSLARLSASRLAERKMSTSLLAGLAICALILAAIGLYGVVSYSVTQRTREIGVRMALGAVPGEILSMVVWQGARLTILGLAIGSISALGLTRLLKTLLFGVGSSDPATFSAIMAILAIVALAASLIPAFRAMRVEPVVALRDLRI